MNPNLPSGVSENTDRARGQKLNEAPILPEPGNVWPGPPQPLPTLNDVSRDQSNDLSGGVPGGHGGSAMPGGSAGSAMHDGGSMSMGESDSISRGAAPGADSFSGGGVLDDHVPDASQRYRSKPTGGGKGGGDIVIPNGDGTSTVISPDGTVKTVKEAPR